MAKIQDGVVARWKIIAEGHLARYGFTLNDVKLGVEAWDLAHHLGFAKEAYEDPTIVDAHIQTALEKIFPDSVFKDRKIY